jgi:hypothetical protein
VVSSVEAFRPKFCPHFSFPYACYMNRHLILLDFITLIISDDVYRLRSSSLCSFLYYFDTFSLLSKSVLLSVLFQNPFILRSSPKVRGQYISPQHRRNYFLEFNPWDTGWIWDQCEQTFYFPAWNVLTVRIIISVIEISLYSHKYWYNTPNF